MNLNTDEIVRASQNGLAVLISGIWLFSCTAATPSGNVKPAREGSSEQSIENQGGGSVSAPESYDDVKEKILNAVQEARATGKTSVDIYLNENPQLVQQHDLVRVRCMARMDKEPVQSQEQMYDIVAGQPTTIPGLGSAVLGMQLKQKLRKTIPPEQAFGTYDEKKVSAYSSQRRLPVMLNLKTELYKKRFNSLPNKGDLVQINPYFKSKVVEAGNETIVLQNLPENGFTETTSLGTTTVAVDDNQILIRLQATLGAPFEDGSRKGRIVKVEENSFWVDFNHPLAGKVFDLDIEIVSILKASVLQNKHIDWIEDHDFGLHVAKKRKKNMVLVLYSDWCPWCKKMLSSSFEDPRIRVLNDDLIWVKVNSDEQDDIKQRYHQDGFPLTVLMDDHGTVIKQLSGFKSADQLVPEVNQLIKKDILSKADN